MISWPAPRLVDWNKMVRIACLFVLAGLAIWAQDDAGVLPAFGTTVVSTSALQGKVYLLKPGTKRLPQFEKLNPVGSIYTTSLDVWPRNFREGFPGVTDRQEWFAIDYTGKFWIEQPGTYGFSMMSDDGSRLWIDDQMVINLDGEHPPAGASMSALFSRGAHRIRVAYFQGPGYGVALVLAVAAPHAPYKIFSTDDFLPPSGADTSVEGTITNIEQVGHPWVPK
jgi:hypothetical protein